MRDFYNGFQENTPVSVEIRISGEASGEPVVYRDKDTIVKLFQALADITVVKKTNEHVTDRYLSVTFELADGNCISLGFEGGSAGADDLRPTGRNSAPGGTPQI